MSDNSRRKVTAAEFNQKLKAQGLNLDVLPQLDLNDNISDLPGGTPDMEFNEDGTEKGPSNFLSDYQGIIKELGLSDIKAQFEQTKKEYQELQDKKNEEISDVNDNPWLSEGIRVKEIKKIQNKYETKENTISNQQKLYESLYEEGLEQAKFIATGLQEDRNKLLEIAAKREEALMNLAGDNYDLREIGGSLYRINKKNGKAELLIKGSPSGGGLGGLTTAQMNSTINQIAGAFDNEPIVKNFGVVSEGYNFAKSLSDRTTNPADDQALIYALAKALDPNSVVREGEYATAQKFSQSWIQAYGKSVTQALNGTGFLSETARKNIKSTINARYQSSLKNYQNVYNEYQKRLATVQAGGFNTLTDYSTAFPSQGSDPGQIEADITETINSNRTKYANREQLINALIPVFPELTLDEVARYVYTLIPDKK